MCIVNLSETICNGSQGIVTGFTNHIPIVKFKHGEIPMPPHVWTSETIPGIGVSQIPLIYAWAITIHKSQGCTLDSAKVNAGDAVFECGQIYVALSRVKSLSGLYLEQFNSNRIFINKKVFDFYKTIV
jgi:ATP-dependent DNA helicase PIF1